MRVAFAVCLCFASVVSTAAQDDRSVGLTIGYPSSVGVIWQVADRVAIRTDTTFSSSWTDADAPHAATELLQLIAPSSSTSGHTFGVGVSVLITVARWERVRAYVAPRAAYLRSSSTTEFSLPAGIPRFPGLPGLPELPIRIQPATFETKTSTQTYSGSFGTQYRLADRFAAFGEVGVAYASTRTPSTASLVFGSGGATSPIFSSLGLESSFSVSPSRPRSNSLGIRSGVGVIFFF
jgi:hypothetical protein